MRHRRAGRKLNRNASHRLAMFRNMCRSLIEHESIRTTVPKAKELRPIIEKLITLARKATAASDGTPGGKIRALHYRRQAIMKLGPTASSELYDKTGEVVGDANDTVLKKLFNVLGPRFASRPGGYTRVLKLHERRLGDAGEQAIIEFLRDGEAKVQGPKAAPQIAPAPALVTTAPALPAAEAPATPGEKPGAQS